MSGAPRLWALVLLAGLPACADETDLRRWRHATEVRASPTEVAADVSLSAVRPAASPPAVAGLSDRAQAALIEQARLGSGAFREVWERVLGPSPSAPSARGGQPVSDRVARQLTVNLSQPFETFRPGDRIERARVGIRPLNFTFASFRNPEIEITPTEGVEVRRASSAETSQAITAGATATGLPVGFEGSASQRRELETNTRIREARSLNIFIVPECLRIERTGSRNFNINGNTSLELTLVTEMPPSAAVGCGMEYLGPIQAVTADEVPYWVVSAPLPMRNGQLSIGAGTSLGSSQTYPRASLAALVRLDFELRRIVSGESSIAEGAQRIERRVGSLVRCVDLVSAASLQATLYELIVHGPLPDGRRGEIENIQVETGAGRMALVFTDYAAAEVAARWLSASARTSMGALRLARYPSGRVHARRMRSNDSPCNGRTFGQPPA